jgi:SDR family mycofactocin-dependent oxidoreductase
VNQPVAIVTGAARGIGAATVAALVADGWRVVAVDSCADDPAVNYLQATRGDLDAVVAAGQGAVTGVVADVRDQAALSEAIATAGPLNALVACAGVATGGGPVWDATDAEWEAAIGINLTGTFNAIRAAVPSIADGGRIVAVASAAGSLGLRHMGPYAAAKHGVIGLIRSLAADLAGTGTTANVVSPGSTATTPLDASAEIYGLESVDDFVRHQEPLGRLIEPAEVAAAIVWLCSPAASAITGAVVPVDGGMTATP